MGNGMDDAQTIGGLETLRDGDTLLLGGRYKVLRRLGEGGMGSVWLAEDLKLDGRKVAVKMLPAVLAGKKGAYKQVKQEALMAMKLSHPNIATVRAFEEEDGNPFLVMDYIEGEGLDDILAEKEKLSETETIRLLTPVAAALDYAHAQGIVHRDVKPGNVIVRKDGTPFVLDFGIAREIQETMTRVTGKFSSGTLLYMSPEQLRGRAPKAAQDVYSFAVVAYECLTGRPPFYRGAVEDQIKNEAPEELPEEIGEPLRCGVMAGLAKEPGGRPGTCEGILGGVRGETGNSHSERHENRSSDRLESLSSAHVAEDVFLTKVRLEKALAAAENELMTAQEREELSIIHELTDAGMEALKAGDKLAAGTLYKEADETLSAWREARRKGRKAGTERSPMPPTEDKPLRKEVASEREWSAGEVRIITLPGGTQMEMVWCPPGSFLMGSSEEEEGRYSDETLHQVALTKGFWMAKYPVTQRQWEGVMAHNPSCFAGHDLPVEGVTWEECEEFCRQTGNWLQLPTEAQWEYACRSGGREPWAYGGTGRLDDMGWYGGNSGENGMQTTHPVGRKQPNAWGLCDMHGNVWEWCLDWYQHSPGKSIATDPMGPPSGRYRVARGGAWDSHARDCRSAFRGGHAPSVSSAKQGFRPVALPL